MTTNATLTADGFTAPSSIRSITDPRLDRVIAGFASLPFAYMLYYRLAQEGIDLPRLALAINYALLIATMVVRRVQGYAESVAVQRGGTVEVGNLEDDGDEPVVLCHRLPLTRAG